LQCRRLAISSENNYFGANHTPTILDEYSVWAAPCLSIKFDVLRQFTRALELKLSWFFPSLSKALCEVFGKLEPRFDRAIAAENAPKMGHFSKSAE